MQVLYVTLLGMKTGDGGKAIKLWKELERLSRALGEVGPDEVCCEGLTPRQTAILRTLAASEGARLSDLAQRARITPSAMTRVVEKLEALDMVERVRRTQVDGRAAMVRITARGRRTRASIDKLMIDRAENILSRIPRNECPAVLRSLTLVCEALEETGCCGPNAPEALCSIETK
jgi:DNA-binding MarR family transcriptional regulator